MTARHRARITSPRSPPRSLNHAPYTTLVTALATTLATGPPALTCGCVLARSWQLMSPNDSPGGATTAVGGQPAPLGQVSASSQSIFAQFKRRQGSTLAHNMAV